ncbi:outer membrane beta-barrel protein [Archangium violaceum]|uniref:outer membrane beta-barrel protein n=1 Tax=Archangium violaceum TaxID=83451 RepID=UPI0019503E6F|nr:outer membrane beta-barrel protein [Archangium violaceum]QRN96400.1 outer membrane beta-barrel protein [Archangium violaceum]
MSFKKSWGFGAVAAATLMALPALAQDEARIPDEGRVYDYDAKQDRGMDFGVSLSGGLNVFTGDLGDSTGTGAFAGIQANARPLPLIGVELGYEGSRNPFTDIDGSLWRHNVGALAKVGPQLGANGALRPFVGAGFGVSILNPSDDAGLRADNDLVTEVPLAAGIDYKFGSVSAGARATYRFLGDEELGVGSNGNNVNVGINLGGAF